MICTVLRQGATCSLVIALLLGLGMPGQAQSDDVQSGGLLSSPLSGASNDWANGASAYLLGPGDQIAFSVTGYSEFNETTLTVLPDGSITLPLVGAVSVTGRTLDQLAQGLTFYLSNYLIEPRVDVRLVTMRPVMVNLAGEVHRPGPTELSEQTLGNRPPTLGAALLQAGGITQDADIREIQLTRDLPGGQSETITINLWDAIQSEAGAPDITLRDGDTIFVPTLTAEARLDRRLIARSSLAPDKVTVRVVGEVNAPGELAVSPESSISMAITSAGGPTKDARLDNVVLLRLNDQGEVEQQVLEVTELNDTYQVEEGDVIVVKKQSGWSTTDNISRLLGPLGFFLNLLGL
jgi:polysaccharide export outer membrane protein